MNRKTLFGLIFSVLLLTTAASQVRQTAPQPSSAASEVAIPFELVNRHVMLKVKVNNSRPLSFVLDTGDRFAIIELERAKELGLTLQGAVRAGGAGAQVLTGSTVQNAQFTVPGLEGFSQPVTLALPFGHLAPKVGQDFDGIIGSEFIKRFIVEIDYQARVIRFHDKEKFSYSGPGESIPIRLNSGGHPIIEAEVTPIGGPPVKGNFVLDIGSGAALALYSPFVAEHRLLAPNLKTIKALGGAGAGGEITGQIGRVEQLKIGNFRIRNPITLFSEDKAGAFASAALLGNIGQRIIGRFKILLDYDHNQIIFEPNATYQDTFDRAFAGLAVQAEGKDYRTFRITEILENSPASEVGLQKNDVITAVADKPAAELTLSKLNDMFELAVPYKLTLQRGRQTLQVTLTPRKLV